MADFTEILSKPAATIEKPKPKPAGTYLGVLVGMPNQREQNEHRILAFKAKLIMPQADVDQDKLSEQPPISDWMEMSYDIFVSSEEGVWALKQFLTQGLGIDPGTEKNPRSLGEMVAETPGKQVLFTVKHEPYMDRDGQPQIAARIKGYAKA